MQQRIQTTYHPGHDKFFRSRLLTLNHDQISQLVESMEKECVSIRQEALKMSWNMRGGLTYNQALALSSKERELIGTLIKDNLDTTKKTGLNFF